MKVITLHKPMNKEAAIKLFEEKKVRTFLDAEQEKWYISTGNLNTDNNF